MDHFRSTVSMVLRRPISRGRPVCITIEPTTACNLRCPVCETGNGTLGRPRHSMSLESFRHIIGEVAAFANTIMLYYMGEPFLNPVIYDMIASAKDGKIPFVTTCTNGEHIDPDKVVASGLDEVQFQIGGMTQETHERYRVGGRLDTVLANLQNTIRARNSRRARMRITCGLILMRHNEHERKAFLSTMAALGVDRALIVDPCVRNVSQAHEFLPTDRRHWYYDADALLKGILRPARPAENLCPWLYYSLTVQADGSVVPCCRDPQGNSILGNILTTALTDLWNGPAFKSFRSAVMHDQSSIQLCRVCSSYGAPSLH